MTTSEHGQQRKAKQSGPGSRWEPYTRTSDCPLPRRPDPDPPACSRAQSPFSSSIDLPGAPSLSSTAGESTVERCNGLDDDCDGTVDNGFDLGAACSNGVGACRSVGSRVCGPDGGTLCDAVAGQAAVEVCNGLDDDCDGSVDDGFALGTACVAGVGACVSNGTLVCGPGGEAQCNAAPGLPVVERCNGRDDDCDGTADDGFRLGEPCAVGQGECTANGVRICDGNGGATCDAQPGDPTVERCNGLDDDCDGQVDDVVGVGAACGAGVGECRAAGVQICGAEGLTCGAQPGQPRDERCNGLDDDCDGAADEGFPKGQACLVGLGACERAGALACAPDGTMTCAGQAGVPMAELCNDVDDNCDGQIDNLAVGACLCAPGEQSACYSGAALTRGVGECRGGTQACNPDGRGFGACVGDVLPAAEQCNGRDEDCNGRVDDGFDLGLACSVGVGACARAGVRVCDGFGGATCGAQPGVPGIETCNGIDDDCDGSVDDGFDLGVACTNGLGVCSSSGVRICRGGVAVCSAIPGDPRAELCNAADDDCDGAVDDGLGLGEACANGAGACRRAGRQTCDGSGGLTCDAMPGAPVAEACNAVDDDCDGVSDDGLGLGEACSVGTGACERSGDRVCDGAGGVTCSATAGAPGIESCNAVDEDCDGTIDDGFDVGGACTSGVGGCRSAGVRICQNGGAICNAVPGIPRAEICNAADDDCDGVNDNGLGLGTACSVGVGACARSGSQICDGVGGTVCSAVEGAPAAESCNAMDDDCDGAADDGFDLGAVCTVGTGICARSGVRVCDGNGGATCNVVPGASAVESCNGLDDDCEGVVDDGSLCGVGGICLSSACYSPPSGYIAVTPGTFNMGSPVNELGRLNNETQHQVTLTRPFALKRTEVTQAEWQAVMGANPSRYPQCGANCPVETVSWNQAVDYCNALSTREGLQNCYDANRNFSGLACTGYRLPTEAEWEYAVRAGTQTPYSMGQNSQIACGNDPLLAPVAWYCANSFVNWVPNDNGRGPHPVGQKVANPWGFVDLFGNVSERLNDRYDVNYGSVAGAPVTDPVGPAVGAERVLRGGGYFDDQNGASMERSAGRRVSHLPTLAHNCCGFRPARTLTPAQPTCNAMKLNAANARISLPNTGFGTGAGDFTFETWVKLHREFNGRQLFASNEIYAAFQVLCDLDQTGTGRCFTYRDFCPCGAGTGQGYVPYSVPTTGWHHIAYVRRNNVATVYVDGGFVASDPITVDIQANSPLAFGDRSGYPDTVTPALVGPTRFSNAARYNAGFVPSRIWTVDANTVAQWLVANPLGATLIDEAGANNTSTILSNVLPWPQDNPCLLP